MIILLEREIISDNPDSENYRFNRNIIITGKIDLDGIYLFSVSIVHQAYNRAVKFPFVETHYDTEEITVIRADYTDRGSDRINRGYLVKK